VTALRNIAIILLLALVVAVVPGGGNAARAIGATMTIAFLAIIAFTGWQLFRQYRFNYMGLDDRRRALFVGAIGAIALMIAGADELTDTGGGLVLWLAILGAAIYVIVTTWFETQSRY
jgi:Kef-type K+ transport system membrane component KefB